MAVVPVFAASVSADGSHLVFVETERARRLGHLKKLAGKRVEVIVRARRSKRSDQQNRWWWGVALPLIAHELGYDKHEHDDLHNALVAKCFGTHVDRVTGIEVPNVRSSLADTQQFSELMEWAVRWAAMEHGIVVPLPREVVLT